MNNEIKRDEVIEIINDCLRVGLLEVKDNKIVITELGKREKYWKHYVEEEKAKIREE